MILNLRLYVLSKHLIILLYYTLFFFSSKITYSTNFFDIITNIFVNDFYWNNFYFVWTQFFILPSLLVFLLVLYNSVFSKYKNFNKNLIYLIVIFFMFWWVNEYYILNQYSFFKKNIPYFFNTLLNNPLKHYHPVLFFSSYIFMYSISLYRNPFTNLKDFNNTKNYQYVNYTNMLTRVNFFWLLISFSLYLGSWWALQEGSWGGWWNWDASEVFGLIILTFFLITFHLKISPNFCFIWLYSLYCYSLIILLLYTILQLSYTLVSHNFGLSLLGYGYVNTTFSILLITTIFYLITLFWIFSKNYLLVLTKLQSTTHCNNNQFYKTINFFLNKIYITTLLLTVIGFYIYFISFNPIINNIFYTSFSLEVFNNWFYWFELKILVFILTILFLKKVNSVLLIVILISNYYYIKQVTILIFYNLNRIKINYILHVLLIIMFFAAIQINNTVFVNWNFINESLVNWYGSYNRSILRNNFIPDNTSLIPTLNILDSSGITNLNSYFLFHNNIDSQFFELSLNTQILQQTIYNHTYLYLFKVSIYDISSLVTDITLNTVVLLLYNIVVSRIKIAF